MPPGFGLKIGRNIAVDEPKLPAFNARIAFRDVGAALPQGFHFGAEQHDARLDIVGNREIEPRAAVFGNQLGVGIR